MSGEGCRNDVTEWSCQSFRSLIVIEEEALILMMMLVHPPKERWNVEHSMQPIHPSITK